jgi:hypothetical protein
MNTRDNRRAVFSVRSVPKVCINDKEGRLSQSSFGVPRQQLSHLKESAVEGDWEESARKAVQRRLHVCCSESESYINPLPGYD